MNTTLPYIFDDRLHVVHPFICCPYLAGDEQSKERICGWAFISMNKIIQMRIRHDYRHRLPMAPVASQSFLPVGSWGGRVLLDVSGAALDEETKQAKSSNDATAISSLLEGTTHSN